MALPVKEVKEIASELISLLGVEAKIAVEEAEEILNVTFDTEKYKGLLIGYRGDTLNAIQSFLSIAIKNKTGEWCRISVNVGDWKEKQDEYLKSLALSTVTRARSTGEAQSLYNLTASQRRVIHLYLADEKDVETESFGEGKERYLVVQTKK